MREGHACLVHLLEPSTVLNRHSVSQVVLVVKNLPANAGDIRDAGLIPGSGRSSGEGNGNPPQYSCLENPHGQRTLAGCSLLGRKESDTTEAKACTFVVWWSHALWKQEVCYLASTMFCSECQKSDIQGGVGWGMCVRSVSWILKVNRS